VVGTDFSDGADSALAQAIELAATANASIALIHAYEDPPGVVPVGDRLVDEVQSRLHEAVDRSGAKERGIRVEPQVRRGAPWEKLANAASDLGATLIVVGAHGERGAMRGLPIGSVAMRVVAHSTQSVFVVRPGRTLSC
jgi:nucleotide-binding universal stress UspA family protein